ncbi:MAG TPA: DUF86 domain-containing protein [Candidatus Aenigmarchaeota archaeon]|nr:MAG: hypothetical protein DRP03_03260 [Candidatus Aenigmarchaeota archaeon]HDD46451.1 DUF86 domain-containing protein [Candidatus Aenigmarchaeota archaeon]
MRKRSDREFLLDIKEACERILKFVEGMDYDEFANDEKTQDAVLRNIEIIGEAVKNLSEEIKTKYQDIEWKKISGMRDRLIHFYFGVNLDIVWDVARNKISELLEKVSRIISSEYSP